MNCLPRPHFAHLARSKLQSRQGADLSFETQPECFEWAWPRLRDYDELLPLTQESIRTTSTSFLPKYQPSVRTYGLSKYYKVSGLAILNTKVNFSRVKCSIAAAKEQPSISCSVAKYISASKHVTLQVVDYIFAPVLLVIVLSGLGFIMRDIHLFIVEGQCL